MNGEGRFPCRATKARVVAGGQAPMVGVRLAVMYETDDGGTVERHRNWYGSLTPRAFDTVTEKALRALGWKGDDILELHDCDCAKVLPTEAEATIEMDDYQGKQRLKVAFIDVPGIGGKELDAGDMEDLRHRIRAQCAEIRASKVGTRGNGHAPSNDFGGAAPHGDAFEGELEDDIPY